MCTVSVKVDKAVLREKMPELDSNAALRKWVQKLVDMHLQQIRRESEHEKTQEDLWRTIEQDPELLLKPSEIVDDGGEAIDLETFRADLHKMIEEVYAEP